MGGLRAVRFRGSLSAALAVALVVFWWLTEEGGVEREFAWDGSLLSWVATVESGVFEAAMVVFSFFGAGVGLLLLLSALVFALLRQARIRDTLFVTTALLLAQVLNRIVKLLVERPRPSSPDLETINGLNELRFAVLVLLATALVAALATRWRKAALAFSAIFVAGFVLYELLAPALLGPGGHSFPSGHATSSMAFAAAVVFVAWPSRLRSKALGAAVVFVAGVGLSRLGIGVHYPSDVLGGWALGLASVLGLRIVWPDTPVRAFRARARRPAV